jgi:hypothetical protein
MLITTCFHIIIIIYNHQRIRILPFSLDIVKNYSHIRFDVAVIAIVKLQKRDKNLDCNC